MCQENQIEIHVSKTRKNVWCIFRVGEDGQIAEIESSRRGLMNQTSVCPYDVSCCFELEPAL